MDIQEIFKICILNKELVLNNKLEFKNKLYLLRKEKGRSLSNFSGYQSNDLNIKDKTFIPFLKAIEDEANVFAKYLKIKPNLKIVNFWLNINKYKDSNLVHNHPGVTLSGVYYFKVPKDSGAIVFNNPFSPHISGCWPSNILENFNILNGRTWTVPPKDNQLLIFPSWLDHFVEPNMNKKEERISIAFNLR